MHRLEMRIDKLRGWLWDELGSFLQDMAVRGDLSDLSLLVDYSTKKTKERSKSIARAFLREKKTVFEKQPLEGLVRLLADPSIRTASLRVKGRHDRAWCDFHQGGDCILKSFMRARDGYDDATKKEDEEVVEIDWRGILRVVDPEAKRRAVGWNAEM